MTSKAIYLDNHSTTPVDPVALRAMEPWWCDNFGNPHSSEHSFGWKAHKALTEARAEIARFVGAGEDEIIFTSGATEANNLAILGTARARHPNRNHIVVSAIEHRCVLACAEELQRQGWFVNVLPVSSEGFVDIEELGRLVTSETALVSIMAVNNEIGVLQPLQEVTEICRRHGTWFHCDAAQAPACLELDVWEMGIDLLSLSSHKIYGPKGVGALYVHSHVLKQLPPLNYGGGQEQGVRSGTVPTPLCVGFAAAAHQLDRVRIPEGRRIASLRDLLWEQIKTLIPEARVNGSLRDRHPGNLNIHVPGCDSGLLLGKLQPMVAASSGAACSTGSPEASHVLRAIGLSEDEAYSCLRFGIGRFNTQDEVESAAEFVGCAARLAMHERP